jgi:hypothetical protein
MGWARASRGEGRGEANGDGAVDLCREKLGRDENVGGTAGLLDVGGEVRGVLTRGICHGAGEDFLMTVCLDGASPAPGVDAFRCLHRASRMVFSRVDPLSAVSWRSNSSSFSILSSSCRSLSWRIGSHSS